MDWVTLSKNEVETDSLPRVCMACGAPATTAVNESFSHTPDWVGWLYLSGFIPGVIAEHYYTKHMRVACPFCDRHKGHWRVMYWVAGAGWLLAALPLACLGYLVGAALRPDSGPVGWVGAGVGAGVGIAAWVLALVWLHNTRIDASKVTDGEITFQGVADAFVKAVKDKQGNRNT
jgi:hypothetical protein